MSMPAWVASCARGRMRFRASLKEDTAIDVGSESVAARASPRLMLVSDLDSTMVCMYVFAVSVGFLF